MLGLWKLFCRHKVKTMYFSWDDGKTRFEYWQCISCRRLFRRKLRGEARLRAIPK